MIRLSRDSLLLLLVTCCHCFCPPSKFEVGRKCHTRVASSDQIEDSDDYFSASLRLRIKELGLDSPEAREAFLRTSIPEEPTLLDANEIRRRYYEKFFIARHQRAIKSPNYYAINASSPSLEPILHDQIIEEPNVASTQSSSVTPPVTSKANVLVMLDRLLPGVNPVLVDWLASKIGRPQDEALNLLHHSEVKHARTSMLAVAFYYSQHHIYCEHCPLAVSSSITAGSSLATLDLGIVLAILFAVMLTELQGIIRHTTQDDLWTPPSLWGSTYARPVLEAFSEACDDVNKGVHFGIEARLQASELVHGRAAMLGAATILMQKQGLLAGLAAF